MVGKTISHYKILEKLGQGGMGVVYKAEDTKLKRSVALKFLPPEFSRDAEANERFIHEAQAASALQHNNICTIHDIDETEDGQMFLCMDYYQGETLKEKIEKGPLKLEQALDIAIKVAQGLSRAHEANITHRDIKPANIMITERGEVKIVDFGLAKLAGRTKLTKSGTTIGTVAYMSPEQARGEDVDFQTDIWSLGVVLYEMITGRLPFEGDYDQAVIYSIIHEEPEPLSQYNTEIGEGLQTIINKALVKNINNRYQTTTDLLQELTGVKEGISPRPVFKPFLRNINRKRLTIFAATILVIIAAYVIIFHNFFPGIKKSTEISVKSLPSIAIMYFENTTGDEKNQWLSDGLPNMLTNGLHQASNLWVPGTQMVYEVLKKIDKNAESVNKSTAMKVALKLGVKTILCGNIFKWGEKFRIDYQIQDVTKNELIYTGNVSGSEPFDLADNLALQILDKLEVDLPEKGLPGIKEITTDSLEALRHYLQGIDHSHRAYWKEACASLFKAINIDTTFAMAYLELWRIGSNAGISDTKLDSMLAKAVLYADSTSEKERLVILALHANYYGEFKKSRLLSKELSKKYPTAFEGFAMLASKHYNRREWKQSIKYYKRWAELTNSPQAIAAIASNFRKLGERDSARYYIEKLISLHPNDALGYVSLSSHYIIKGEFDKAIHEAQRAVAIKPLVPWPHRQLARAYFFANQLDSAEVELERVAESGWEAAKIVNSAIINCFQRKHKMVLNLLQQGKKSKFSVHISERTYYDLQENRAKAKEIWLDFESDYYKKWFPEIKGKEVLLAYTSLLDVIPIAYFNGDFSKALGLCADVDDEIEKNDLGGEFKLWNLWWRSNILHNAENYKEASIKYKELIDEDPKTVYRFRRALCLYKLKKYKQAKQALLQVKKTEDHSLGSGDYEWNGIAFAYSYPRTFYLLGLVNEKLEKAKQAIQAYQRLLEIWKDADEDLPELIDAKARYAKLIGEK